MDFNSDHAEILEKIDEDLDSDEKKADLGLEIKIEENIKIEVIEKTNNSEPHQIIGEKRKNDEISTLENEHKKIKEEFVVFEESDYKQEPQFIEEINLDDSKNQVINIL